MKTDYKCKENDAIITLSKDRSEVSIKIDKDTSSIIVGREDLKKAMELFSKDETEPMWFFSNKDKSKNSLDQIEWVKK